MTNDSARRRFPVIAGNVLIYLVGILLVVSAVAKVAQPPGVVEQFRGLGFEGGLLTLVGILEATWAALFMIPRTRSIGLLLVSSHLGGAIATHLGHGQYPPALGPGILLALAWLGACLRHPCILWSFKSRE